MSSNTVIDKLVQGTSANSIFLDAANSILREIVWLDKDEEQMMAICSNGMLNPAS